MKAAIVLAVIFLVGLMAVNGGLLGGERPTDESDTHTISEGTRMIQDHVRKQYETNENGQKTNIDFSEMEVKKQVVNGSLYNFKFNITVTYVCPTDVTSNNLCQEKPPVTKACTASVWKKPAANSVLEFAKGKEPKCE